MRKFKEFIKAEDGLATIEWVGLAAVAFVAAVGISAILMEGADGLGGAVAGQMDATADDINGG